MSAFTHEQQAELRLMIADELRKILPIAFNAAEKSAEKSIMAAAYPTEEDAEAARKVMQGVRNASILLSAVGLELANQYCLRLVSAREQVDAKIDTLSTTLKQLDDEQGNSRHD